jgi:hypothetical protein
MFTVKYRTYNLAPVQNADPLAPRCYDEVEMIYGTFELVSKEQDVDGNTVVHCHRPGGDPGLTIKHCDHGPEPAAGQLPAPRSKCWVMNEQGATVAKYDL